MPMVVSRKHIAVIDPHRRCVKVESETAPAGTMKKLTSLFKHKGHVSTYESIFNLSTSAESYEGTIFRFPLRRSDSRSEISDKVYTPDMLRTMLFESLKEESPYVLLFLRNIKSISLMEWTKDSTEPRETFRVSLAEQVVSSADDSKVENVQANCEVFARQCSQSSETDETDVYMELKSTTVTISDHSGDINRPDMSQHHWLVLKVVGTNDSNIDKLGKELAILPWVGLATRLPGQVYLSKCEATTALQLDNGDTIDSIFREFQSSLSQSRLSLRWSSDSPDARPGHAYCFLPLPECTAMPVHVHGYFAVTDNRRSIKWPAHDEKGKEAQWNRELLTKMVAPAYALLLASRASLIHYESTPLPIANTDHMTDAYSTWPLYPEVKNVPIWNELLSPTVDFSSSLPLLWTAASGGKWVKFNKAYFLPGSHDSVSLPCNQVVIKMLNDLDIPIVSLPRSICETLNQNQRLQNVIKNKEITPQFVRQTIINNNQCCSLLSKAEVYQVLQFVLSDIGYGSHYYLVGLPLLPLRSDAGVTTFQEDNGFNNKFIFASDSRQLLEILPGADSLVVDPDLPEVVSEKLCEIAASRGLQLRNVDTQVICKQLLPKSISSWCTKQVGNACRWLPGVNGMPPQSWIKALWKWIAEANVQLSMLEGLPIIPQLPGDELQEGITLIKVSKCMQVCRLSNVLTPRQNTKLVSIMKKLNFLIADQATMNNCSNMMSHPDFNEYVPEVSMNTDVILKHLGKLDTSSRTRAIETLDYTEKDFLREFISNLPESNASRYQCCLQSIPIYRVAGSTEENPRFISLTARGKSDAFLPPDNMSPLPDNPANMLHSTTSHEERTLLKNLLVKQLSISDLCRWHLIPLAITHIQSCPWSWCVGDDIVLWILRQQHQPDKSVLDSLSHNCFFFNRNSVRKRLQELYDPQDSTLSLLFDMETDTTYFPNVKYLEETHCRQALLAMGMKTWKDFQRHPDQMKGLLRDRMQSVQTLQPNAQLSRGQSILQVLAEPYNTTLHNDASISCIKFLTAQPCPSNYPSCLREKWYGQQQRLYSISELICALDDSIHSLIGTVMPILSHSFHLGMSTNALDKLAFQRVTRESILQHLTHLQSAKITCEDVTKVDQMVMRVYDHLYVNSYEVKLPLVWSLEKQEFVPASKFVLDLPQTFPSKLEPFYYELRVPIRNYSRMFNLHIALTQADIAAVIPQIKQNSTGKLTSTKIVLCVAILNWLCENHYQEPNMLMITEDGRLISTKDCVFDDREWMKKLKSRDRIKGKSLTFVHDRIPQKVAKHFKVVPLSRKVAPSEKLGISFVQAGQHEDITQRIRHIVQEYETNIDIFKELIQNADDARATEIKFLIDWRQHPTESLISEELKEWQGPALIAYNDATFSDEDFDNICKVAGETKRKDPLKTGRFGVGFCATYHLTDVPSFISRKYFTMFDPHVSYLRDRISSSQPGMRVDLVENQEDLGLYEDQFAPYNSVFGCNVFNLTGDGYQGTLFRFPFRCQKTSSDSKICSKIYERTLISSLVRALKEQSNELLLFLKNVSKVSVFELESGREPSSARELFSVRRTNGTQHGRLDLIKTGCNTEKSCSTKFNIEVKDTGGTQSQTWLISSAIKPLPYDMIRKPEASGLLPLAEVGLQIDSSKECLKIMSCTDSNPSKVFCFLPLPIQSKLPFHVNGFFSVGKDRRNVAATDDKTFGSQWNKSLAEGALVSAFVHLLHSVCNECNLQTMSNSESKAKFLRSYYALWNVSGASGIIGTSFEAAFKKCASALTCPLIWSEINGGQWLSPTNSYIFKDSRLKQAAMGDSEKIMTDAITLLLRLGYGIVDVPNHIYEVLKKGDDFSSREFDYKRLCCEILFPMIKTVDSEVRDRNVKFLVERFGAYFGVNNWYEWAKDVLMTSSCIPCENSDTLRQPCELIDPTNIYLKNLFDVSEGRFPSLKSTTAKEGLAKLGMTSTRLSLTDLRHRAESVARLSISNNQAAIERSLHLCEYIESTYYHHPSAYRSTSSYYYLASKHVARQDSKVKDEEEVKQIFNIPFLPVKDKPEKVDLPWNGNSRFDTPARMYSPEKEHLVFTQHPIVDSEISSKTLSILGISAKEPNSDIVAGNLKCIISYVKGVPNEETTKYLDDAMRDIYTYFQSRVPSDVSKLTQLQAFIWQNGCFLSPDQVLGHWTHSCVPYLCELSSANKRHLDLMTKAGVKDEETTEVLVQVLQKVYSSHDHQTPISDEVLEFVAYTSRRLESKLSLTNEPHNYEIYLPDENRIMRRATDLADNIGSDKLKNLPAYEKFLGSGNCYYIHNSIPRQAAVKLGVQPLLDAILEDIEDKDFLSGTEFGQHEELCDRLNGILKKYPPDVSIFKEFIQNADDAQATEIIFVLDRRIDFPDNSLLSSSSKWKSLQHTPALCIYNNRKFTEADIEGITRLGRGGKGGSADQIGKFGVGFNVAYHVTDCPSFVSYSENGTPEYLCVFDPTKSFVSRNVWRASPGRKWNFKDGQHHSGFRDQFRPYLPEDLPRFTESVSACIQDKEKYGHVVFRLPLTRYGDHTSHGSTYTKTAPSLSSGYPFYPSGIERLFSELTLVSQDILLFLNNLKSVSAFEIKRDGSLKHHFTTRASLPLAYLDNCKHFSQHLKQYSHLKQRVSMSHKLELTHITPESENVETEWLVQRVIAGSDMPQNLVQAGLNQGLRLIGGVATQIKPVTSDHKYLLFCFLPLPMQSNLPVHVNGHFLVDDSRKHLENIEHFGLKNWNVEIAQHVIVPAYVDLIVAVKDTINVRDPDEMKFFYSLFPKEPPSQVTAVLQDAKKKNAGEFCDLNVVGRFYNEILRRNPAIFLREVPSHGTASPSWMKVTDSLFCVPFMCNNICLTINDELHSALVSLGLPITSAPSYIYYALSKVASTCAVAGVEPKKVIEHLKLLRCTEEQKDIIKKNILHLLRYCMAGYDSSAIQSLFTNALYLLTKDGSLQRGYLFLSAYSDLLPQYQHKFIDSLLEESAVGARLIDCQVVRALPMGFVSDHIELPNTTHSLATGTSSSVLIKRLWEYLSQESLRHNIHETFSSEMSKHFSNKAIIPASDGKLYPVSLSKVLVRTSSGSCDNCQVMKKLGCPHIDFSQIGMDTTDYTLKRIIDDLTSCFQTGEDIVNCLQLKPPSNTSITLTEDETISFIASLGKVHISRLREVSSNLLKLPLFHTIDGSRIALDDSQVTKVFILASTDLPLEGIPTSHNGRVVLKAATSESMRNFYNGVIRNSACVGPEEFYMQLVLPILPELQEENIKAHIDHIYLKQDKMKAVYDRLKDIRFIHHNGTFYRPKDLCDHTNEFYRTFKADSILPASWQQKKNILINLGLQSDVSQEEWLQCAKSFSQNVAIYEAEEKSQVLFNQLCGIVDTKPPNLGNFLQHVADIQFLYSPQSWELTTILLILFPNDSHHPKARRQYMVKFRGSVSAHECNLACLCRPVLPERSLQLVIAYKQYLSVELPVSPHTVAENLKRLCTCVSKTCARSFGSDDEYVPKLIKIFHSHYACLGKWPDNVVLSEMKDTMCILLSSRGRLLQLVKPSQLVVHLPSDCFLEPYCYKVESELRKHLDFLMAVGVKQELTAQDYIDILASIQREAGDEDSVHDNDGKVIECAYKGLISCLRQGHSIKGGEIYLPDESLKLTKTTQLCLNDAPWYENRLPQDFSLKMICQPPVDDKGHRTLPDCLHIKHLSEIIVEELQDTCKSSDFTCNQEVLFAQGKRPTQCKFVQNILETLKSDELFHGFCRMYYTEYKRPPTESFKILVRRLKQIQVRCIIGDLKTVLCINGQPIKGTEDVRKMCHLCNDNGTLSLFIAPHEAQEDCELSQFFRDLAVCISKLLDNEIKNSGPIAAVFECYLNEIPVVLNREHVYEYSEDDSQTTTKAVRVGIPQPWNEFSPKESLIVLNFEPEDPVRYIDCNGVLINAEVVQCGEGELLERKIVLKVREDDNVDSKIEVSPLKVFKVLTAPQKRSLWSGSSSPYASPLALANVPCQQDIVKWMNDIKSALVSPHPDLVQAIQALRLIGHMHYQLVIQKKDQSLFNEAAEEFKKIFCNVEQYTSTKARRVVSLIVTTVQKLTASHVPFAAFPSNDLCHLLTCDASGLVQVVPQSGLAIGRSGGGLSPLAAAPSGGQNVSQATLQPGNSAQSSNPVAGGANPPATGNVRYPTAQATPQSSRYGTGRSTRSRRGYRKPKFHRYRTQQSAAAYQPPPQPDTCMRSATAWLEQAKADFSAAESLLCSNVSRQGAASEGGEGENPCKFPALVCFLCHDTVEKCIKGVLYAYCGLRSDLVNCSNLTSLHDNLTTTSHCPAHLVQPINECVMTVNRHENRSRFPNYQNPPCAPATVYYIEDAQEAFRATLQLLQVLQGEEKLSNVLQDLGELPTRRFMSTLKSSVQDQGMSQ